MHRAFKLNYFKWNDHWYELGKTLFESMNDEVIKSLEAFIENGGINGTLLRDKWFPEFKSDVFISHSHKDEKIALNLAGYLKEELGLSSFIDSRVWGYSADLLQILDKENCWQERSKTYNYNRRNGTTSHVHMMLATALSRMIDSSECVIFVSSPNSVSTSENLDNQVSSPWIFYELSQMEVIRKRPIDDYRSIEKSADHQFSAREASEQEPLAIKYKVSFDSLTQINAGTLKEWRTSYKTNKSRLEHPLDYLYELKPHQKLIAE